MQGNSLVNSTLTVEGVLLRIMFSYSTEAKGIL